MKSTTKNNSPKTRMVPYFTRQHLMRACRIGLALEESQNAFPECFPESSHIEFAIDLISEMPDVKYPVVMAIPHLSKPYARCVISLASFEEANSATVWCDVPREFFRTLPRMRSTRANTSAHAA